MCARNNHQTFAALRRLSVRIGFLLGDGKDSSVVRRVRFPFLLDTNVMRIAVIGAGALNCLFGGQMAAGERHDIWHLHHRQKYVDCPHTGEINIFATVMYRVANSL